MGVVRFLGLMLAPQGRMSDQLVIIWPAHRHTRSETIAEVPAAQLGDAEDLMYAGLKVGHTGSLGHHEGVTGR